MCAGNSNILCGDKYFGGYSLWNFRSPNTITMTMRKKIVAGNWKMNMSCHEATALFSQILEFTEEIPAGTEVIIIPPSLYIKDFAKKIASSKIISIGAQN